jgi:hypothetical protein
MKINNFISKASAILTLGLFGSSFAMANVNPTMATLKIYGVAVSTTTDCSNAKVVGYNAAGQDFDFLTAPALAAGTIDPGTYQCVVLYMENSLQFKPASTVGSCTGGALYKRTICSSGGGGCMYTDASPDANNILVYGADKTPDAASSIDVTHPNKVLLYLSTASTGVGNNAFRRPDAGHLSYGLTLTSPLVVAATGGAGTFVVNFNGQVDGSGGTCDLGPPTFGFR